MPWNLAQQLADLDARSLRRTLRTLEAGQGTTITQEGRELLNFSSNDYLGLTAHSQLRAALVQGAEQFGAGSGASRLVCGSLAPHRELEARLAAFKGTQGALAFTSGYAAALGTITALVGPGDTIILDKLSHASLVDAARLSGATLRVFPHNHTARLGKLLESTAGTRTLVVTESVFSMDGDVAALAEIVELKDRYGAWLLLDEAHAVGALGPQGRGLAAQLGLESRVELQMGTLSKALGLIGGYIAASHEVTDLLVNKARSFIYTTAPPPCIAHAACTALQLIASDEGDVLRARLQSHLQRVSAALGLRPANGVHTAILPIILGAEETAIQTSAALREAGLLIPAIRYPTVAKGSARLRLTLSAAHTEAQIDRLIEALGRLLKKP